MIWYKNQQDEDGVMVSTRIRLARNLAEYNFPRKMSHQDMIEAKKKICDALKQESRLFEGGVKQVEMSDLDMMERRVMLEEHLVSQELINNNDAAVLTSTDDEISIMLMEEDHIRMQVIKGGFALREAYELANRIDDAIERHCEYAFSENFGYLTSCPTNVGTGMRVSVMMHLPALTATGNIDRIIASASRLGLTVRGMYGEGSKAYGALYQLSNQVTLGCSEIEIIEKVDSIAAQIKQRELETRNALKDKQEVADKLWRSLGILKYARSLSSQEAKTLLSDYILGRALGIIDESIKQPPLELMVLTEPAHVAKIASKADMTPQERDTRRAELVRMSV